MPILPLYSWPEISCEQKRVDDYTSDFVPWWEKPTILIREHKGFVKVSKSECSNFFPPSSSYLSIHHLSQVWSNGCHASFPLVESSYWYQPTFWICRSVILPVKNFHCAPNTTTATHPTLHILHFTPLWFWSLHKVKFDNLPLGLAVAYRYKHSYTNKDLLGFGFLPSPLACPWPFTP